MSETKPNDLSSSGIRNFENFYKRKVFKYKLIRTTKIILAGVIALALSLAVVTAILYLLDMFGFQNEIVEIILVFVAYIPPAIVMLKIQDKFANLSNIKEFFAKFSKDGVFNYCFECNKEITPKDNHKCSLCETNLKVNISYAQTILETITLKRKLISTKSYNVILIIILVLCIFTLIPLISSSQISQQSYKTLARHEAFFYAHNNKFQYLEPISNEMITSVFDEYNIIRYDNKMPIRAKVYYTSDFSKMTPFFDKYILGQRSKEYVTKYCTAFNKYMNLYIKENHKKTPTK